MRNVLATKNTSISSVFVSSERNSVLVSMFAPHRTVMNQKTIRMLDYIAGGLRPSSIAASPRGKGDGCVGGGTGCYSMAERRFAAYLPSRWQQDPPARLQHRCGLAVSRVVESWLPCRGRLADLPGLGGEEGAKRRGEGGLSIFHCAFVPRNMA
jgi:hypothetical protein